MEVSVQVLDKKEQNDDEHRSPHDKEGDHQKEEGSKKFVVTLGDSDLVVFRICCTADHPLPYVLCYL